MKKLISTIAALALIVGFATTISAQEISAKTPVGEVSVSGRGEIMVDPNEFKVTIVIDEQATRESLAATEKKMFDALQAVGIDKKTLQLSDMSSTTQKRRTTTTTAVYQLTLTSAAQVQDCFSALNDLGIRKVELTNLTHSDMESYQSEARKLAVADAQSKAAELAEALGLSVGYCKSVKEYANYNNYAQPTLMRSNTSNDMTAAGMETLEFNKIKVQSNVDATFVSYLK